jgi:DNA-nicking Smr family endonuclease
MNIGDRVRFLHSKDEGIIRKIIDKQTVEVEIEDGFRIPVLRRELVPIATEEKHIFDDKEDKRININAEIISSEGLFLAFAGPNARLTQYFINNTDYTILCTIGVEVSGTYKGLGAHILKPKQAAQLKSYNMDDFEHWGTFVIQILYHLDGGHLLKEGFTRKMKLKASTFHTSKTKAPVLNQEAYLIQIDADHVNASKITEKFGTSNTNNQSFNNMKLEREVDLHIEKLVKDYHKLSPHEIMTIQLETFQKHLENALAIGMHDIIFIHGAGNGTLRTEIHKKLSKNKDIKFYQDAQKEKFGYGATLVQFNN